MNENPYYRTEQLILHICRKLESNEKFGSTLLNKILYYADNYYYVLKGKPITELTYVKQKRGPTPEPATFLKIRESLIESGKANIKEVEYFGKMQKRLIANTEPDLTCFTGDEIAFIDSIIDILKENNATSISELSHEELSWKVAKPLEKLPFYTYLLSTEEVTENDLSWARKQIAEVNV